MKKIVTILVGLPGSGKSTYLNGLAEVGDCFVYSTDNVIEREAKAAGKTYDEMFESTIAAATKEMDLALTEAIKAGKDVYMDQTNLGAKKRRNMLNRFPKDYVKVCICRVPPNGKYQRVQWGVRLKLRPGKTIPDYILDSMLRSYTEPEIDEGFDEIHLYDMYGTLIGYKAK